MTTTEDRLAVNLLDGAFYSGDPFPAWAWMRANEPLYHDRENNLWAATRWADVKAMGSDPATFSNASGHRPNFYALPMLVDMDPPLHHQHRKLVSAGFTPRRIQALEANVRAVCDAVIDEVCELGECDFVRDIAAPLPLNMIADMLGVEHADRADLLHWSEQMLRSQGDPSGEGVEAASLAFGAYLDYMGPVFEQRLSTGKDDDLIGILVHAELDGDRLDKDSVLFESLLILIGGDETTRHVLSGGMLALQQHPEQLARLQADPAALPNAVEEMLRWVTPIKNMNRTVTRDIELHGQQLEEGAQILLMYPSANRDETVFAQADSFDVTRDPNPHLAFGFGSHFCLGNQLARIELRIMFSQLFARLPDLRLAGPGPFPLRASNFISGIETMPVQFTPGKRSTA